MHVFFSFLLSKFIYFSVFILVMLSINLMMAIVVANSYGQFFFGMFLGRSSRNEDFMQDSLFYFFHHY